jgi:ABC-type phosphate transport system permease subunit
LHKQAWAGSLVLLLLVLVISLAARFVTRSRFGAAAD